MFGARVLIECSAVHGRTFNQSKKVENLFLFFIKNVLNNLSEWLHYKSG
jgi:hypothetical protein